MRITNQMMTTNMLNNIMSNKTDMNKKFNQYATGKKIQTPSEDPVVAIRSLKYRANLTELTQYKDKNVKDAYSWMDVTESALNLMNSLLTDVYGYANQGANDTYETIDRDSIVNQLEEYKEELYGMLNADNAGRYVFAGYRTDTSVCYTAEDSSRQYTITEPLTFQNMYEKTYLTGCASYQEGMTAEEYKENYSPNTATSYCLDLAYKNLDEIDSLVLVDENGNEIEMEVDVVNSTDEDAYAFDGGSTVKFVADTGQIIFSSDEYDNFRTASSISAVYKKSNFETGDLRPEMYYDCTAVEYDAERELKEDTETYYAKPTEQDIYYHVNFGQSLKVNTLANQVMNSSLARSIDNVLQAVNEAYDTQNKIDDVKIQLNNSAISDEEKEALKTLQEQMESELALRKKNIQESFSSLMVVTKETQDGRRVANTDGSVNKIGVNIADTSLGSRYKRLKLVQTRLEDMDESFTELLDSNEAVDLEEAIINYNSAQVTYTASLNAASKVVQNTLLDFL